MSVEFIIGVKRRESAPAGWMDKIATSKGIKEKTRGSRYLFVESFEEVINGLKKKYPYLVFEEVIYRPTS